MPNKMTVKILKKCFILQPLEILIIPRSLILFLQHYLHNKKIIHSVCFV